MTFPVSSDLTACGTLFADFAQDLFHPSGLALQGDNKDGSMHHMTPQLLITAYEATSSKRLACFLPRGSSIPGNSLAMASAGTFPNSFGSSLCNPPP